jgi:xanthine dehydrogenase small subunit
MNEISFVFRGKIESIKFGKDDFSPNTTLLQYLRTKGDAKGVKEGCNEGDCGACTVVMVEKTQAGLRYRAVNSCVVFLPSVHGKQILTIEDIGNVEKLHPIQEIFVNEHASQCGFCTPGFIMSLFAQKADKIDSSEDELVEAIHGNLCRCTGYRPIVTAASDIAKVKNLKDFASYSRPELIEQIDTKNTVEIIDEDYKYFIPYTLDEAVRLKKLYPNSTISSGGTDLVLRVTKRKERIKEIIDISSIEEIQFIRETDSEYVIGAGTKMEDLYQFAKEKLPALADMLAHFGAKQIRNRASIGGNIATASPIGDILPVLFAYSARLILYSEQERSFDINNFVIGYRKTSLLPNEFIKSIVIPKPSRNQVIKSYKLSKRKHLDISTVSAGFMLEKKDSVVEHIILAYGGMAEKTKRALKTENFLRGKNWTEENIRRAFDILDEEYIPITDARASAEARKIMAKNILLKFFLETTNNK